jgi:maltose O-acetyltransferase
MPILESFGRFLEASLVFGFRTISILSRPFRRPASGLRASFRRAYWKYKLRSFGDRSRIYPYVVIHSPENVGVGNHVEIAEFVHIWGNGGVDIEDFSIIGAHSIITTLTHDKY